MLNLSATRFSMACWDNVGQTPTGQLPEVLQKNQTKPDINPKSF
jgi:hypothetical protein